MVYREENHLRIVKNSTMRLGLSFISNGSTYTTSPDANLFIGLKRFPEQTSHTAKWYWGSSAVGNVSRVTLRIDPSLTSNLSTGTYYYDVWLTEPWTSGSTSGTYQWNLIPCSVLDIEPNICTSF